MSYAAELKRQLAEREIKKKCCRRALLDGIFTARATLLPEEKITLTLPKGPVATLVSDLLTELRIPSKAEALGAKKTRQRFTVTVGERDFAAPAIAIANGERIGTCDGCAACFLRGVFLAGGRLSDFEKEYRIEISAGERYGVLLAALRYSMPSARHIVRRGEQIVYCKVSGEIFDFLGRIGAETAAFELLNATIRGNYRDIANRTSNCEFRNIRQQTDAMERVNSLIRRLIDADMLGRLPDELRETAILRMENPELSLAALGRKCSPTVTKSGMNHRLERLERLAKELLKGV